MVGGNYGVYAGFGNVASVWRGRNVDLSSAATADFVFSGTALPSFGTVVSNGSGNYQTIPAFCNTKTLPPVVNNVANAGVAHPGVSTMIIGAGSFQIAFLVADTGTYSWSFG